MKCVIYNVGGVNKDLKDTEVIVIIGISSHNIVLCMAVRFQFVY
jgi:hypothetical protein